MFLIISNSVGVLATETAPIALCPQRTVLYLGFVCCSAARLFVTLPGVPPHHVRARMFVHWWTQTWDLRKKCIPWDSFYPNWRTLLIALCPVNDSSVEKICLFEVTVEGLLTVRQIVAKLIYNCYLDSVYIGFILYLFEYLQNHIPPCCGNANRNKFGCLVGYTSTPSDLDQEPFCYDRKRGYLLCWRERRD